MIKKIAIVILLFISGIIGVVYQGTYAFSSSGGAPAGNTGSPGDGQTCGNGGCHGGGDTFQSGWITSDVPGTGYIPGNTYSVTVSVEHAGVSKFGFQASPQDNSGNLIGTLATTQSATQLINSGKYITHDPAATSTDSASWSFDWTAPSSGTGDVTFYGAMLATNGDLSANSDDICYRSTLTLTEDASVSTSIDNYPGGNKDNVLALSIFPNPASDVLNISLGDKTVDVIEIYNIQGVLVKSVFKENIKNVDVNDLNKGIYFMVVENDKKVHTEKFTIQ